MRRNNLDQPTLLRRCTQRMMRLLPYAAAAAAALVLWSATRTGPMAELAPASTSLSTPGSASTTASASASRGHVSTPGLTSAAALAATGAGGASVPLRTRPPVIMQQASMASTLEVIVGRNDTLDAIFRRAALDTADLAAIRNLPGIRQSLDFLKPGDSIKLTHNAGEIETLSRKVSETQTLTVERGGAGFAAKLTSNPVETRIRTATAIIDSSLFQAAEAAEISDTIALKLADVFAWDIDFVLDIREGDRFTAVYEQIYQDGKYLHDGDVLAAEFVNNGKVYRALRFSGDGGVGNYYTPAGLPMRKAFLRAPVEFTRVSSVFNPHRKHPILNLIRGHMGTDYAAPTGTPVHAAGEGRISFAGRRGGYGNALVLAHSDRISTLYGHMSRFAAHMRVGTHVQQGEVIGYVGMTGLATGPHLHYEYLVNGVHRNPQTVQLPGAEPLRADVLAKFRHDTAPLLADLMPPVAPPSMPATPVSPATPVMRPATPNTPSVATVSVAAANTGAATRVSAN